MERETPIQRIKDLMAVDLSKLETIGIYVASAIVVFLIFYFFSRWLKNVTQSRIKKNTDDPLLSEFIGSLVRVIVMLFGLTIIFRIIGLTGAVGSLLAGAGITAFVIGFALKDIGENFLAGVLLAFKRPFRVGDTIEINNLRGRVLVLNLRDTQIKTADGKDLFIPNANIIKSPLFNFTIDGFLAYSFDLQISIDKDLKKVLQLITESTNQVSGVLNDSRKTEVFVSDISGSTVKITTTYWVNTFNKRQPDRKVRSNVITNVVSRLKESDYL